MKRQHLPDPIAVDSLAVTDGDTMADAVTRDAKHYIFNADDPQSREKQCRAISGEEVVVISRTTHDRAAVVTTAIIQIVATAQGLEQRQALENYLRDEITDIQRQAVANGEPLDA